MSESNETKPGDVSTDQLIELTAHLERIRALAIIEAVQKIGTKADPATLNSHFCGWATALEEVAYRLKTEAWGMLPNGGWGPTGAANEDDRPSPEFPALLRHAIEATTSTEAGRIQARIDAEEDARLVGCGFLVDKLYVSADRVQVISAPSTETSGDQAPSDSIEKAPWPDMNGNELFVGDVIRHPGDTSEAVVGVDNAYPDNLRWRAIYPDGGDSYLGNQIGDRGLAVLVRRAAPQLVERKAQPVSDNGAVGVVTPWPPFTELPDGTVDWVMRSVGLPRHDMGDIDALRKLVQTACAETVARFPDPRYADASQAHGKSEAVACRRCGGTGVVDDGEIDCYPNGEPYLNGPVKCVKDCPACADRAQAAAPAADAAVVAWDNFPSYLIDHCEGQVITEEGLQFALAAMLRDPKYSPSQSTGDSVRVEGDAAFLCEADMADLQRFADLVDDGEDYDIAKERMKRLADLGVVKSHGFGRYSITSFGRMCLGSTLLRWPLETIDECNERLGREHAAKLAQQAAPAAEGGQHV